MSIPTYIPNQFLIAMPGMDDPTFQFTVSYICEHNEQGAVAIVINKPMQFPLTRLLNQMSIPFETNKSDHIPIVYGGPMHQERGFVLHSTDKIWRSTIVTSKQIAVTTSRDVLEAIAAERGPGEVLISLGYAGWAPGQLEQEIKANLWLTCEADLNLIFHTPFDQRWLQANKLLGIDPINFVPEAGHA